MPLAFRTHQVGTSLIEVLVAVVILAIGLLGYASVQTQSLRLNGLALQQAQASWLADDWFDRLRANRVQALNSTDYLFDTPPTISAMPDCANRACPQTQIARRDLYLWLHQLALAIPGATATSERTGRRFQLTIRLAETATGSQPQWAFGTWL